MTPGQPPVTLAAPDLILAGGGEMGARMRAHAWDTTPVGPPAQWPQSLRTALSILLASGYPMYIAWGEDFTQFYNDAYRPILGTTKHPAALGASTTETFAEIWDFIGPMFQSVLRDGITSTYTDQLLPLDRNGYVEECYFDFSYSPIRDESGGVGGVFVTCSETTGRVIGERRLRTLRDLADIIGEAPSAEGVCSRAARVLADNQADLPFALLYLLDDDGRTAWLRGVTGLAEDPAACPPEVPLTAATLWDLGAVARGGAARLVAGGGPAGAALPLSVTSGEVAAALTLPIPQSGTDRLAGILVAGISPRRALDADYQDFLELVAGQIGKAIADARASAAERQRAEALAELDRAKTAFFSNVSHEFRTPLTLLLGPLQDLLDTPSETSLATVQPQVAMAQRNALRLLRLVNTLLDFSRIEAGRVEATYAPTDLGTFTADLASAFRSAMERAGLELRVDCPPAAQPVYVDRAMWEKVVFNLLSNALKFTLHGSITVTLREAGGQVELQVADTGVGIPEDQLPHVFERFHRIEQTAARTQEGTGIGLALVQELVKLHGGTIAVDSTPGQGTTFRVTLPTGTAHLPTERVSVPANEPTLALGAAPFLEEALRWLPQPDAAPARPSEAAETAPEHGLINAPLLEGARVLVADDNADMRGYLRRLLGEHWQVDTVADGEAALDVARAQPPDLILADVMMPRLDGFALLQALRADARTRDVPIVLLSARAGEEARVEGLQAGADDYLTKPFAARELVARVGTHLALGRLRREVTRGVEQERARLLAFLQQAPAAICILSGPEHVFTLANPRYLALVGRPADIVGRPVHEVFPELHDQPFLEILDQVRATGTPYVAEEAPFLIDRHGTGQREEIFLNFVYQPIRDAAGQVAEIFVQAAEVTRQVRATAAEHLARAEAEAAVQARDEFLSIASHELRNPVAALRVAAQSAQRALGRQQPDLDRLARFIPAIATSTERLARLLDDLLDVSRLRTGQLQLRRQAMDLAAVVRAAVANVAPAGARVHLDFACDPCPLWGDPDRLAQVVENLVSNAIKYSPADQPVRVRLERRNEAAVLQVQDHGIGLPADSAEAIFEPFGRAGNAREQNIPGMGLGLYICRQIVQSHGGRIWAESPGEGQGSIFWLAVPPSEQADS